VCLREGCGGGLTRQQATVPTRILKRRPTRIVVREDESALSIAKPVRPSA
jgi:hypothetical protein